MNRQRQKIWFRLITMLVITAMVCQNMAWARGMDYGVRSALAPNRDFFKDASAVNMKMAKIGEEFIDKIAEYNESQPGSIKTIPWGKQGYDSYCIQAITEREKDCLSW